MKVRRLPRRAWVFLDLPFLALAAMLVAMALDKR